MTPRRPLPITLSAAPVLFALAALCACATAEDGFTQGRSADPCSGNVPVCSSFAGCVLDDLNYTSGDFAQGAARRVIVRTTVPSEIEVQLFFRTLGSPGLDTEISWYEVGCRDRKSESSGGADVFAEAGPSRVWSRKATVFQAGDHLVEVFSDAQAGYLLKVLVRPTQ